MKKLHYILLILLCLTGCANTSEDEGASIQQVNEHKEPDKKVILVILDSMMGSLVDNSMEMGKIPALEFLIENGQYYKDLVSPFPTMSVVIESSILTGKMAHEHLVPGLVWYNEEEQRLIDYGSSIHKSVKLGLKQSLIDSLYHLNNRHLNPNVKTIFEELQDQNYTTGAVNTILYRGRKLHDMTLPSILDEWLEVNDSIQTFGPDLLAYGSIVKPKVVQNKDLPDTVISSFGFNDKFSVEVVKELIKSGQQPDFLMVYLPSFDKEAHRNSPHYRVGFEEAERAFQEILNAYDSWEEALQENIFIVIGDHGQDKLKETVGEMAIDLDRIYKDYEITKLTDHVTVGDLVVANNHRMSYIYPIFSNANLAALAEMAMIDDRVEMAAYLKDEWVYVMSPDYKETFRFKPGTSYKDRYDQWWDIEGNEEVVTIQKNEQDKKIAYVDYPDVLNQLYSALHSHKRETVILTAKPGFTFKSEGAPLHEDGGEHGGIHKNDSLASMIIAGTDKKPKYLRMVDLKSYILEFFE